MASETDSGYFYSFPKFKNSKTSFINPIFIYQKFNFGIFLDIFPLDYVEPEEGRVLYEKINRMNIDNSTVMRMKNPHLNERDKERVKNYPGGDALERYAEIRRLCLKSNSKKSDYVASLVITQYPYDKKLFFAEDFSESVYLDFEGIKFPAPAGYERILKTQYGDYMEFPPPEERGKWHGNIFYDADTPYKKYFDFLDFIENIS